MEFRDWLEKKFLAWQNGIGKRQTLTAFAHHLGLSQPLVNQYLSGKVKCPSDESLRKIADKLGPEVYDLLGLTRPNPRDRTLLELFHRLNDVQQDRLLAYVSNSITEEVEN